MEPWSPFALERARERRARELGMEKLLGPRSAAYTPSVVEAMDGYAENFRSWGWNEDQE